MLAWAGPLPPDIVLDSAILHLAPVARELPRRWHAHARFVGLTPRGCCASGRGDGAMALARADAEDRGAGGRSGGTTPAAAPGRATGSHAAAMRS